MNFQSLCFLMFKMKYLIDIMYCNNYHNKWGGLMVGVFVCNLKVKGSNLISGVVCGQ
jgi:hypothetical protein